VIELLVFLAVRYSQTSILIVIFKSQNVVEVVLPVLGLKTRKFSIKGHATHNHLACPQRSIKKTYVFVV